MESSTERPRDESRAYASSPAKLRRLLQPRHTDRDMGAVPRSAPPPSPTGLATLEGEASATHLVGTEHSDSRPKRIQKRLETFAGIVLAAFLGAFFVDNPQLVPVIGPSGHHRDTKHDPIVHPPTLFSGTIAQPGGASEFSTASLNDGTRHHAYDTPVSIVGYCIGQATRNSSGAFDERWLILSDGKAMPAPEVHVSSRFKLPLQNCPGASGTGGPKAITLTYSARKRQLLLRATASHATTVGFAVFDRRTARWQPVALRLKGSHEFLVHTPMADAPVAMAVPCWAPHVPANPAQTSVPVHDLQVLGKSPDPAYEDAVATVASGSTSACSGSEYGSAFTRPKKRNQSPSPRRSQNPLPASRPIEAYKSKATRPTSTSSDGRRVRRELREE
jgi:hypothetical protein